MQPSMAHLLLGIPLPPPHVDVICEWSPMGIADSLLSSDWKGNLGDRYHRHGHFIISPRPTDPFATYRTDWKGSELSEFTCISSVYLEGFQSDVLYIMLELLRVNIAL